MLGKAGGRYYPVLADELDEFSAVRLKLVSCLLLLAEVSSRHDLGRLRALQHDWPATYTGSISERARSLQLQ